MEYLLVHRGKEGHGYVYELSYDGKGEDGSSFVAGLGGVDASTTKQTWRGAGDASRGSASDLAASSRGDIGPLSGASRGEVASTGASQNREAASLRAREVRLRAVAG